MAIVELRDISLRRGKTPILDGVNWTIRAGEHWALLGANGSGKTTLLKVLTGYEWASAGAVTVLGRAYGHCDVRELRKTIGWVSAALQTQIPKHLTAVDVALSGFDASLGVFREFTPAEKTRAGDSLSHLGVGSLAGRTFGTLSQGEQQRVLIARALVSRPALLVLDEPCAGLDPIAREHFLADLTAFVSGPDAPTTVLVTHHIEEIGPWITHALVLKAGRTLASGAAADVLRDDVLSAMLDADCRVHVSNGRFRLDVLSHG